MATQEQILNEIGKLVEESAEKFNGKIPGMQDRVWAEIQLMLKGLDTKGDMIIPSVKNLKLVGSIGRKLQKILVDDQYKDQIKEYLKAFNDITKLQNRYFSLIESKFKTTPLLQAIREESISTTLDGLLKVGISQLDANIKGTLLQNITTGGSFKELMSTMAGVIKDSPRGGGGFNKAIKTYTITSVAQYSRNYSQTVAEGLNFIWYQYVGSTITTTRCFCHAMVKKRYFHRSEIPKLIAGEFDEFEEMECPINDETDLPDGMFKGTNASNFMTYAGGWNCQHSIFPVPDSAVPQELRDKFKNA